MRDAQIYNLLRLIERPIKSLQISEENMTRQIITLRTQLNAIILTFKVLLPLRYLYSFFYKMEWKRYSRQLKQRQRLMEKFTKEQNKKKERK